MNLRCVPFQRDQMTRRWIFSTAMVGVVGLAASLSLVGCDREGGSGREGGFSMPPLPVETVLVQMVDLQDRFTAIGSLSATDAIVVMAEIDASVRNLPFEEGAELAAGDLIAHLDDRELRAQVDRADAVADQRRANHERVQRVVSQGAGAPQDLDDAAAALKIAVAELELARARLAKTRITAPFAGLAGRRLVSPGAYLRAGTPITDLAAIDELRVSFNVPERLLARLRPGLSVQVRTIAFPDRWLPGTIDVIDPVLDATTRGVRILARVPNAERRLRPGMSAEVSVVLETRSGALTLPGEAVFAQGGQTLVYEVQPDSTVAARTVELGLRQRETVEILSGLEPGARVVRAGHQKLFPGARVLPLADAAPEVEPVNAAGGDA